MVPTSWQKCPRNWVTTHSQDVSQLPAWRTTVTAASLAFHFLSLPLSPSLLTPGLHTGNGNPTVSGQDGRIKIATGSSSPRRISGAADWRKGPSLRDNVRCLSVSRIRLDMYSIYSSLPKRSSKKNSLRQARQGHRFFGLPGKESRATIMMPTVGR